MFPEINSAWQGLSLAISLLQVVTLQEAKALLREDDDLIIAVYDYWLNKRLKTVRDGLVWTFPFLYHGVGKLNFWGHSSNNRCFLYVLQSCLHYTLRGINYTFDGWITHYTSRVVDYTFRCTQTTHFIFVEFSILVSKLVKKQRMVTNF